MYNLPAAALAATLPLMRQCFAGWQPLDEPDRGLRDMQRWRPLLQSDSARDAIFQVLYEPLHRCHPLRQIPASILRGALITITNQV